jgi:hypothetical protein
VIPVDFIEGVPLLFGAVQHISNFFVLEFDVEGIKHELN